MNKINIILLFCGSCMFGQTALQVKECSNYLGKNFFEFEKALKLEPQDVSSKFGLEKRMYKREDIIYSLEEVNDDDSIGEIIIAKMPEEKNNEIWYNISKDFNSDPLYKFSGVLLRIDGSDYVAKDFSYNDLISYLRKDNDPSKLTYQIKYIKSDTEYNISMMGNSLYISLQKIKK